MALPDSPASVALAKKHKQRVSLDVSTEELLEEIKRKQAAVEAEN